MTEPIKPAAALVERAKPEPKRYSTREIVLDFAGVGPFTALTQDVGPRKLGHNPSWVKATDYDALKAAVAERAKPEFQPVQLQDGKSPEWTCPACGGDVLWCKCQKHTRGRDVTALPPAVADRATAPAPLWHEFIEKWIHNGHLQTYEDRERFRAEGGALLRAVPSRREQEK